jgi:hypothetical protein
MDGIAGSIAALGRTRRSLFGDLQTAIGGFGKNMPMFGFGLQSNVDGMKTNAA